MTDDQMNPPSPGETSKYGKRNWERDVLEKVLMAGIKEQRSRRRWGIFFKLITVLIVLGVLAKYYGLESVQPEASGKDVALVEIDGTIDADGNGSADNIIPALQSAFDDKSSVGVILKIDSPGGSPLQAGMIYDAIMALRKEYPKKPIDVVVGEMCASGGYYIASAANNIYVNRASIVGSIGVLMDGFDFSGLMKKLGIERRLLTAGENKGFLDPFSPMTDKQKQYAHQMLEDIHQQFIDAVLAGRGKRLKVTTETFSGLFWVGDKAVSMGLADGYGTVDSVARDRFQTDDIIDYTTREGWQDRVFKKFGVSVGNGIGHVLLDAAAPRLR